MLRLTAYTELKGKPYQAGGGTFALMVEFGEAGVMALYERNCLIRSGDGSVFHLEAGMAPAAAAGANAAIGQMLSRIPLLDDAGVSALRVRFVDQALAAKPLEPFDKLYLRHLLLHFGVFDSAARQVEFRTEWLPPASEEALLTGQLIRQPLNPLRMRLDTSILRGWLLWSGGTVYLENARGGPAYASGDTAAPSHTAFKHFIQQLFVQSLQYVVNAEHSRAETVIAVREQTALAAAGISGRPLLYHPYQWIPMMLGMLRMRSINIGDPDVICYFVHEPYYPLLYEQMNPEERRRADRYVRSLAGG